MFISPRTFSILDNFSEINKSLLIEEGNVLCTLAPNRNILAKAEIQEDFPLTFGIYDLHQFLSGLKLFENPEFIFDNDKFMIIRDKKSKVKYFYADKDIIPSPPAKSIPLNTVDVEFILEPENYVKWLKASSVYQLPNICVEGDGSTLFLTVKNKEDKTSNSFSIEIGETDKIFSYSYSIESLKILPGKYNVKISKRSSSEIFTKFTNLNSSLEYYIACEPEED